MSRIDFSIFLFTHKITQWKKKKTSSRIEHIDQHLASAHLSIYIEKMFPKKKKSKQRRKEGRREKKSSQVSIFRIKLAANLALSNFQQFSLFQTEWITDGYKLNYQPYRVPYQAINNNDSNRCGTVIPDNEAALSFKTV